MRRILLMRKDEAVQAGNNKTHTVNAGKDETATDTDVWLPPSMRLIVPHTVRSQMAFWSEISECGASLRAMSYYEQLAEVEKLNRGRKKKMMTRI